MTATMAPVEEDEARIRDAHARGAYGEAIEAALERYGNEVLSFLRARLRDDSDANEVFAQLGEDLWRGVVEFRWQCSFRTFIYTLARNAAVRFERAPMNQGRRRRGLSALPEAAASERLRTRPYLRTDVKDRFAALRASLTPDEQTLLVLRVDREMSWEDVARVLCDGELDADALRRHSATLRQRFQKLKAQLRERAIAEGLLGPDPESS